MHATRALPHIISLCLTTVLACSALPATASPTPEYEPELRLHGTADRLPIGALFSFGRVIINGRAVEGGPIWGGEWVQARYGAVRLGIVELGEVVLARGAVVRVDTDRNTLLAKVLAGRAAIQLLPRAEARVQAAGIVYAASPGTSAAFSLDGTTAYVDVYTGAVIPQASTGGGQYFLKPVGLGADVSVRARSTRQLQIQVTDERGKARPNVPIVFALGDPGAGTLAAGGMAGSTVVAVTDASGIATVVLNAGSTNWRTTITATVEGRTESFTFNVDIGGGTGGASEEAESSSGGGGWSAAKLAAVFGAIGAGIAVGVVIALDDDEKPAAMSQDGPPVIIPQ